MNNSKHFNTFKKFSWHRFFDIKTNSIVWEITLTVGFKIYNSQIYIKTETIEMLGIPFIAAKINQWRKQTKLDLLKLSNM